MKHYSSSRVALFGVALLAAAAGGYIAFHSYANAASPGSTGAEPYRMNVRAPAAPPGTIKDPVSQRPVTPDEGSRPLPSNWIGARPGFQYSKPASERGGIEPCSSQPVDKSAYDDWTKLSRGQFVAPRDLKLDSSDRFDLVVHLHGDEPVLRELILSGQQLVLYSITLDPSQSYAPLFTGPRALEMAVMEVEQALSKRVGRSVKAGRVAMSAWSAGFVGINAALAQHQGDDIDAAILIDGLHAPRGGDRSIFQAHMKSFTEYAARAAAGERFMYVSHSSIDPAQFASTTECAHFLISQLDGKPKPVRRADALGLELVEYFTRGNFHVRGYAGNDKPDHCAQFGVLRDVYAALGRRWAR